MIHMTPKLDAGPCLAQETVTIDPEETVVTLEARLAKQGVASVAQAIAMLETWDGASSLGTIQDAALATKGSTTSTRGRHRRLVSLRAVLGQSDSGICDMAGDVFRNGSGREAPPLRVIFWKAHAMEVPTTVPPGTLFEWDGQLVVATGQGALHIETIQPAGKKPQAWEAFLRGYRMEAGARLPNGARFA